MSFCCFATRSWHSMWTVAEKRLHYAAVERLLLICFLLSSRVASNVGGPVLSTGLTIQVRVHPCRWLRMQILLALL